MKNVLLTAVIAVAGLTVACKKSATDAPPVTTPLVTEAGIPDGEASSKIIGAAGGSLSSKDGRIAVSIPTGALTTDQTITIQPITNMVEGAIGNAYRLMPQNIQLSKSATVSFTYTDTEIKGTVPQLLNITRQKNTGAWYAMSHPQTDVANKKVSVATTEFGDLGLFKSIYLQPSEARLEPSTSKELTVMGYGNLEDLFVSDTAVPLKFSYIVPSEYIGKWQHSGEGILNANGAAATYTAPAHVPSQNPEAVSVEIKMKEKGTFWLLSNITILSAFHIDYMQVDETEMNVTGYTYASRLYIYGKFGPDPGAGKRKVTIDNTTVDVAVWSADMIVCNIPATGTGSSGNVVVTANGESASKMLNEWTVTLNYERVESPGGSLKQQIRFVLRLRGDGIGYGSGNHTDLIDGTDLNKASKAIADVAAGTFTTQVKGDGCGTYKVDWSPIAGYTVSRGLNSTSKGLRGEVKQTAAGFSVKLDFTEEDLLTSTRTFKPCVGATVGPTPYKEAIALSGFHNKAIELNFFTAAQSTPITFGSTPTQVATGAATGLYWDPEDVIADLFTIKMSWEKTLPKFQ